MENSEYSPLKYKMIEFNEPPNIILNKINTEGNYNMPNIITKNIRIKNNNPINEINSKKVQPKNVRYIKKIKNKIYPNKTMNIHEKRDNIQNSSRNISVYSKKRVNDGFLSFSVTSGVNSALSNTQKNNILGNIEFLEKDPNNNIENKNINNIYNIKTTNDKSTNILIKNIYSNDDYFSTNIKEGLLHLKDFEIFKSNKISQMDMEREKIKNIENLNRETNKPLSMFLIKTEKKTNKYNLAKNYENIHGHKNCKSSENIIENRKIERDLIGQFNMRRNNIVGKISRLMNYFNKRKKYSDKIIVRGTRNEKGGVVDFTTNSPKKYYKKNRYFINLDAKNKNLYKYPKWKIISSAKIIQKWWRNKMILYYIYLNKIRKIQKNYRKFLFRKSSEDSIEIKVDINKNKKIGIILIKKVIEVKLGNIFSYVLIKIKNSLENDLNSDIIFFKYNSIIKSIIDFINNIKRRIIFSFFIRLKDNKFYRTNYLESTNESNLFFIGKKKLFPIENEFKTNNDNNSYYYGLNFKYGSELRFKYNEKEILDIINIFYRILLKYIIDKIRKEANRRTLIKAFRNINNMKYPILFFSLLKLHKYSTIKYNVMNAYAILIQRNYRYFRDNKSQTGQYYY